MNTKIKGNFKKIIYSNNNFNVYSFKLFSDQNYAKTLLQIDDSSNYINVISPTTDIDLTLDYEVEIKLEIRNNAKYKYSYYVISKEIIIPNHDDALIRFLSSTLFKGISMKTAEKLVTKLGNNFINDIENYEQEIKEIIGDKKTKILFDGIKNKDEKNQVSKEFIENNFSMSILSFISNKTKKIKEFLETKVFSLIEEDVEFNFIDIDKIAKFYLKDYSNDLSNQMLIFYSIISLEKEGSTINDLESIYNYSQTLTLMNIDSFKIYIKKLFDNKKIIIHNSKKSLTTAKMYEKEKYIVKKLEQIKNNNLNRKIEIEHLYKNNLDDVQLKALVNSLSNSISIITGGPGTGKTLLIDLIIKNLSNIKIKNVEVLAPTGKAATQISYRTNHNAKTFHSFLKWNEKTFEVNEMNPSDAKVIIIDEFSMININLFYSLLIACPFIEQLIIVGDKDQLPPIGPGYLLNDLIESNKFLINRLEKVYRQSEGSLIAKNSILIKNGQMLNFDNKESILINMQDIAKTKKIIENNIDEHLENNDDLLDHQILIPMYGGLFGIDNINEICQNHLFKDQKTLFILNGKSFFRNDKVIQLENINDKNIFNGEIGLIKDVIFNIKKEIESILVEFSFGKVIEYTASEFNKYTKLAYAISIHKFQGSECSTIILILSKEHYSMLSKKLFYTAYTRARKNILIISTKEIIDYCINNDEDSTRNTNILKLL